MSAERVTTASVPASENKAEDEEEIDKITVVPTAEVELRPLCTSSGAATTAWRAHGLAHATYQEDACRLACLQLLRCCCRRWALITFHTKYHKLGRPCLWTSTSPAT